MNLFIDTETSGLPEKGHNWDLDYKKFPRIVTIAWKMGKMEKSFLVHQEGKPLSAEVTAIHGVTTKMGNDINNTVPLSFVLTELMIDADKAMNIIGHNIYFDTSIIKANNLRLYGPKSEQARTMEQVLHKDKRIDTMRETKRHFKKWPKLIELYQWLFKESFEAHGALNDVRACERCYNELKKRKLV